MNDTQDKLLNKNFCLLTISNFLTFFAFYMILPILVFYLTEDFGVNKAEAGIIISCFTVATLLVRPFSGYFLDVYSRKPIYLISFILFTLAFGGYIFAGSVAVMTAFRFIHGLSFGTLSVAGSTIVIDALPSSRRTEGIGYYGIANNLAMCFGPMAALFLYHSYSCSVIFAICFCISALGVLLSSFVKLKFRPAVQSPVVSLDRFILLKGLPAGLSFLLFAIPYACITNYIAMYIKEIGLAIEGGTFFTLMAVGMIASRIFAGKLSDRGKLSQVIIAGMILVTLGIIALAFGDMVNAVSPTLTTWMFCAIAASIGLGCGSMFPAANTLFVNIAPKNRRGTSMSTFLTAWDMGIGLGILFGGVMSEYFSFPSAFVLGGALAACSTVYFAVYVSKHYEKNRINE